MFLDSTHHSRANLPAKTTAGLSSGSESQVTKTVSIKNLCARIEALGGRCADWEDVSRRILEVEEEQKKNLAGENGVASAVAHLCLPFLRCLYTLLAGKYVRVYIGMFACLYECMCKCVLCSVGVCLCVLPNVCEHVSVTWYMRLFYFSKFRCTPRNTKLVHVHVCVCVCVCK
jgi:hypothetical protein